MFVYVLTEGYSEPARVFIENITATLNEWADMWPNDIFFFSEQEL